MTWFHTGRSLKIFTSLSMGRVDLVPIQGAFTHTTLRTMSPYILHILRKLNRFFASQVVIKIPYLSVFYFISFKLVSIRRSQTTWNVQTNHSSYGTPAIDNMGFVDITQFSVLSWSKVLKLADKLRVVKIKLTLNLKISFFRYVVIFNSRNNANSLHKFYISN